MKVNEIFYSLQGEGRWTGTPAVFLRFAGCNLKCDFCDTNHEPFSELTESEIMLEIEKYPAKRVILTGGEPALQLTESLLDRLHRKHYAVHIETNGSIELPAAILRKLDWITCSPKFNQMPKISVISELKVVYHGQDISQYEDLPLVDDECRYLQPCDRRDDDYNAGNLLAAISYVKEHPVWKLSLQTHKMINIR